MQEHVSSRGVPSGRLGEYAWSVGTAFLVMALAIAVAPAVRLHAAPTLVAAYHFNESSGPTLTDVSGRNNHDTLVNGPAWTVAGSDSGLRRQPINNDCGCAQSARDHHHGVVNDLLGRDGRVVERMGHEFRRYYA